MVVLSSNHSTLDCTGLCNLGGVAEEKTTARRKAQESYKEELSSDRIGGKVTVGRQLGQVSCEVISGG